MSDRDRVRREVSRAYARAVTAPAPQSCCGATHKGQAVQVAGYREEELRELPEHSVVNAFGCGNPLAFSDVRKGDVVLDLGCGAGIDLLLAARKVGPSGRVIGVDMTDEMLESARRAVREAGFPNVEVRAGLIEDLPVDTASVDWVISNCVINLSPEKDRVFAGIARVLKPGGRMRVSDIVVRDLPVAVREDPLLYSSCLGGAISEEEYVLGLQRAGLVDVEIRERIVYDALQLETVARSESRCDEQVGEPCVAPPVGESVRELAEALEGEVWSALVVARKPESRNHA